MTYNEIIKQALAHLEYGTDEDALATFSERFMIYANDAIRRIADKIKLEQVDTVQLNEGHFSLSDLSKPLVTKIVEVYVGLRQYPCVKGDMLGDFVVGCINPDATVKVRYRWIPEPKTDGDEVPDIPEIFHNIIYLYIVHAHHNTRSTSSDYDRTKWLAEFERQCRVIARAYGAFDEYIIKNKPWQTREM